MQYHEAQIGSNVKMYFLDSQHNKVHFRDKLIVHDQLSEVGIFFKSLPNLVAPWPNFADGSLDGLVTFSSVTRMQFVKVYEFIVTNIV